MICAHFNYCGGCSFQDIPYQEQLAQKEKRIKDMADFFSLNTHIKPINHFQEWYYRNKMELTFSSTKSESLICGLHKKREKRRVFDLYECLIFSPRIGELLKVIKEFLRDKYPPYNKFLHRGFLRHLIIREAKFTQEMMIGIVTTSSFELDAKGFVEAVLSTSFKKDIKSVYWIINDRLSDAVIFEKKNLLYGESFITEKLKDFNFRIFIDSFFQTNSYGINTLYSKIEEYAHIKGGEKVLDLYCGVGSIGMFLAKKANYVWGVEIKKEIVENAILNAQLNDIRNISFICEDVKHFLAKRDISNIDIMVINPPRCGLSKKIKKYILKAKIPTIFYSSCNPDTFFPDLKDFAELYRIEFIEPFDFFPHTPHLECLALLRR